MAGGLTRSARLFYIRFRSERTGVRITSAVFRASRAAGFTAQPTGPEGPRPAEGSWGYQMVFAIMLGLMIGAASVLLIQQWASDSLHTSSGPALPKQQFPRLAPPQLPASPALRMRRAA